MSPRASFNALEIHLHRSLALVTPNLASSFVRRHVSCCLEGLEAIDAGGVLHETAVAAVFDTDRSSVVYSTQRPRGIGKLTLYNLMVKKLRTIVRELSNGHESHGNADKEKSSRGKDKVITMQSADPAKSSVNDNPKRPLTTSPVLESNITTWTDALPFPLRITLAPLAAVNNGVLRYTS